MDSINLLPKELTKDSAQSKVTSLVKRIAVVLGSIVIVAGLGAGAYLLVLSFEIRNTKTQVDNLKSQVLSLQSAEQQVVLIRDRIAKAKALFATDQTQDLIAKSQFLSSKLTGSLAITNLDASPEKIEVTVSAVNSRDLVTFLSTMASSEQFESVGLKSFNFSPNIGFTVTLELT